MQKSFGPGPGAYLLPATVGYDGHDPSRYRNPQYTMRPQTHFKNKMAGPGPQYNVDNMTRYGKASPPAYTCSPKFKGLVPFNVPGPGTYSPEQAPRMKDPRPPAYTIAARFNPPKRFNTPGPNQYTVPSTLGPKVPHKTAAAAYSMGGKHAFSGKQRSPGPAQYGGIDADLYKQAGPKYTMMRRCGGIFGKNMSPGPAAYLPNLLGNKPGGISFGIRTNQLPYITAEDHLPCID